MLKPPLVTVLLPVYNAEGYLREAIESILNQTFSEFEFLLIDDGSTDASWSILNSYHDRRIKLVRNEKNSGLTYSLNYGLQVAKGKYLARMDADDVSLPDRLMQQVAFMETHPQVGVCGTWLKTIGRDISEQVWRYPVNDASIKCQLVFNCALAHPTVMLRTQLFRKLNLKYELSGSEDYDLWIRASPHMQLANLPVVLLGYRLHDAQKTQFEIINGDTRNFSADIYSRLLMNLSFQPTHTEINLHRAIGLEQIQPNREFVSRAGSWLKTLQAANQQSSTYPEPEFSTVLALKWYKICRAVAPCLGWWAWQAFWHSSLSAGISLPLASRIWFGVRCTAKYIPFHPAKSKLCPS